MLDRGPRERVFEGWLRGHLARLVLLSAGERPPALPGRNRSTGFLIQRLGEVAAVLTGAGPAHRLLSTPDHAAGWLDPATLVDRLSEGSRHLGRHDLVAALLRLHPDGRSAALLDVARLDGQFPDSALDPVRYALGGPPPRGRLSRHADTAWWIAASRARTPVADDDWLLGQGIKGAGRSRAVSASLTLLPNHSSWTDARGVHAMTSWSWTVQVSDPSPGTGKVTDEPTATDGYRKYPNIHDWSDTEDFVGWQALIWPPDTERFLIDGVHPVLEAATSHEVAHDAVRVLDALDRHPGGLGPLAWTTLAAGLTAARADERARAVDAVLQFADTGRLTAEQLALGLAGLAGPATLNRWAGSLKDVAAAGPSGRRIVIAALGAALPSFDPTGRGLHALLELLREELLREQAPTPAALLPWLAHFSGSSRTAATARALLSAGRG